MKLIQWIGTHQDDDPLSALSIQEYMARRTRRLSYAFIGVLAALVAALIPVFLFLAHNTAAAAGAGLALIVAVVSVFLVKGGRPRIGNGLFLAMSYLIVVGVSFASLGGDSAFSVVLVSVVGLSIVVLIPSGLLVAPMYTLISGSLLAAGIGVSTAMSGEPDLVTRIPLFMLVFAFAIVTIFFLSRIQDSLMTRSVQEMRTGKTRLDRLQTLLGSINDLRTEMQGSQERVDEDLDRILDLVSRYTEQIGRASRSAEQVSGDLEQTKAGLARVAESANTIATAISQQAALVDRSAQEQRGIRDSLSELRSKSEQARGANEKLETLAGHGREDVSSLMSMFSELQGYQEKMADITKVIGRIAAQTNMLAMNASIEAAHAGELGAGFAVVADEVRNLADEANSRTKEISGIIKSMAGSVYHGVSQIQKTNQSFSEIDAQVHETTPVMQQLSETIEQHVSSLSAMVADSEELVRQNSLIRENTSRQEDILKGFDESFARMSQGLTDTIAAVRTLEQENSRAQASKENLTKIREETQRMSDRIASLMAGGDSSVDDAGTGDAAEAAERSESPAT